MEPVTNKDEIKKNLSIFFSYDKSEDEEESKFFLEKVKEGICFLVLERKSELIFAPSRFIGYKNNNMSAHKSNVTKYGGVTNNAIKSILNDDPKPSSYLEDKYSKYCERLGIIAKETGIGGHTRKFWLFGSFPKNNLPSKDVFNIKPNLFDDIRFIAELNIGETEKEAMILERIGQGKFRKLLIEYWKCCSVTKMKTIELLKASHIKPWRVSDVKERLDQFNGLLLQPNIDILFDKGYITFDDKGNIILSDKLEKQEYYKLGIQPNMKIKLHKNHHEYLKYHRDKIYNK